VLVSVSAISSPPGGLPLILAYEERVDDGSPRQHLRERAYKRRVESDDSATGKFDEVGKRPDAGASLKLKVPAKGDDCEALVEHAQAE
jgi:hypothetical protein